MDNKVTESDNQLLSQYIDGELPPAAARNLEQRLASEPALRARLDGFRALNTRLQRAFVGLPLETVPRHISDLLDSATAPAVSPRRRRQATPWPYALAASLVVAVCGALLTQWDRNADSAAPPSATGMDHELAQVLEQVPSGSDWTELTDGRTVRPVLTFRHNDGGWCREYLVSGSEGDLHAVACRAEQRWSNTVFTHTQLTISPGEYRPASAADPEQVSAFIDRHAADIALGADQETALIARGWQSDQPR